VRLRGVQVGLLRVLALALILAAGLVAVDGVAASSTAPKPDPPPVKKTPPPPPPPRPVYQAPPPVYQAPPPPPVASRPPPASGPTAAQVLAAKRAEARAKTAARRAARLKKRRREARRKRKAAAAAEIVAVKRAAESPKLKAARRNALTREAWDTAPAEGVARPFVVAAAVAALLILGLAFVPAYVVPWHRMSIALEDHREHFAVVGGMTLFGAALFLALTLLGQ
jgi:type IV secretory pathway VirB10-like protein